MRYKILHHLPNGRVWVYHTTQFFSDEKFIEFVDEKSNNMLYLPRENCTIEVLE